MNADVSPGDWSARTGADQWSPPSVDRESAIFDAPDALKRPSCQAAQSGPAGAAANSGMMSPERTPWPAMLTPASCISDTMIGSDHVAPPSVERMTATLNDERPLLPLPPFERIRSKPSIRTP